MHLIFFVLCATLILELIYHLWGKIDMKNIKRRVKNKIFHDRRCRKLNVSRWKEKNRRTLSSNNSNDPHRIILHAPKELSVFEFTETSLIFFEDVMNKIKQCKLKSILYFDLSQVEIITPDAVMYLIAIINNTKKLRMFEIACEGNMPKNPTARAVFQDAGFFKFVSAPYCRKLNDSTQHMKIQNGVNADNALAAAFCEFVHGHCAKDYKDTKRLYPMIVELMTNTYQHAYNSTGESDGHLEMNCNWYIFAQDIGEAIHFVFLDTGVGIPRTVARKTREAISDFFNANNDPLYLESALKGDYSRSETKLNYRGKGLPGIYEDCQNGQLSNLKIISCKAKCIVNSDTSITSQSVDSYFEGTLFSWDIIK